MDCIGPFALDDNDVIFLSSSVNSYIGDNATHLWWHARNIKIRCGCRQVRTDPMRFSLVSLLKSHQVNTYTEFYTIQFVR